MTNDDVGGDDKQEESSDVVSSHEDKDVTLLMLGEGDFSYSLDMARYYRACSDSCDILNNHRPSQSSRRRRSIHLIATGIDTYDSLIEKYKDTPFVIECLKQQQQQQQEQLSSSLSVKSSRDHDDSSGDDPSCSKSMLKLKRVSIHHCVNAIVSSSSNLDIDNRRRDEETKSSSSVMMKIPCLYGVADCVVFNHPHLGTEDAARHGRFLCHLFDSVRQWWLKSSSSKTRTSQNHQNDENNSRSRTGGIFCLTLVDGQYERWNCKYAAERHGFVLLDRRSFHPPPPRPPSFQNNKKGMAKSYYEFRRHQTGKSFASRRPNCTGSGSISGSETFTFAIPPPEDDSSSSNGSSNSATKKSIAIEAAKDLLFLLFPWQQQQQQSSNASCEEADTPFPPHTNTVPLLLLTCPYCDRTFKEERSRKSHIRDKHPNGADKKLRQEEDQILFPCCQCDRSFGSSSALQDHVRSKHSALHKNILPDWHKKNKKEEEPTTMTTTTSNKSFAKKCNICGLRYRDKTHEQNHLIEFDPTYPCQQKPSTAAAFRCQFCSRIFREQRAKLQHENFCKDRKTPS